MIAICLVMVSETISVHHGSEVCQYGYWLR